MDVPIYKPVSIIRTIPQWIAIGLFSALFYFTLFQNDLLSAILLGAVVILIYRYLIRYTVMLNNVRGIRLLKKGNFDNAIICFDKVNSFFLKHELLDQYGFIIFLSSSKYRYRELALVNLAFAYAQKGDIGKAKEYYEECLKINPGNGMARSSLNFINAREK